MTLTTQIFTDKILYMPRVLAVKYQENRTESLVSSGMTLKVIPTYTFVEILFCPVIAKPERAICLYRKWHLLCS